MKNRKYFLIILCVVVCFSILIFSYLIGNRNDNKIRYSDICRQINISKEKEESFLITVNHGGISYDVIDKLKDKYNIKVYEIDVRKLKDDCVKEVLEDTGEYDKIIAIDISVLFGYDKGKFAGVIGGEHDSFETVEEYLDQIEVIKIPVIEDISYEKYLDNIKLSEYFLVLTTDEEIREKIYINVKRIFPDVKFDIINTKSDFGKKIAKGLVENSEIGNVYPQIIYFNNGEVSLYGEAATKIHLEQFKEKLEKLN